MKSKDYKKPTTTLQFAQLVFLPVISFRDSQVTFSNCLIFNFFALDNLSISILLSIRDFASFLNML